MPGTGLCSREREIIKTDKVSGYNLWTVSSILHIHQVKRVRKCGRGIPILYRVVGQGLFDKVKFEHRPEGREGISPWIKEEYFRQRKQQVQMP